MTLGSTDTGRAIVQMAVSGVARLPGFHDSLLLLIERERYSLTDIAEMFGVSRERIRQLARARGIAPQRSSVGMNRVRVWNDMAHRFEPRMIAEMHREAAAARALHRIASRRQKHRDRLAAACVKVQELAARLERSPTQKEIAHALRRGAWCGVMSWLGYATVRGNSGRVMTLLGLGFRTKLHRYPRRLRAHCGRGHPFEAA